MTHIRTKVLDDLPPALRYSAGVFSVNKLLRTVFSVKELPTSPEAISLEALDDDGLVIANPTSNMMRVVGNSWKAVHGGVIANTSTDYSGDGRWNNAHQISGVVQLGGWVFAVVTYAEGLSSGIVKWKVGFPNKRYRVRLKDSMTANWIDTDGRYVFVNCNHSVYDEGAKTNTHHAITIALEPQGEGIDRDVQLPGSIPFYFDDNRQVYYALTHVSSGPIPSPDGVWSQVECTSGFTVNTNFYIVAREGLGQVAVYNRANALVQTWTFDRPRHVVLSPDGTKVWVSSGENTLECYVLNADGSLGAKARQISGLVDPVGVSISPDGTKLVTIDGNRYNRPGSTATHIMRVWSTETAALLHSLGSGDYYTSVLANERKFMFINAKSFMKTGRGGALPYVRFLTNDLICIGDTGCFRNLFYSLSSQTIVDRLYYTGYIYSVRMVANRERWVMGNYCMYDVDWPAVVRDKTVVGHWQLRANYAAHQRPEFDDDYNRGLDITMFPDGRMVAFLQHQRPDDGSTPDFYLQVIELNDSGIVYFDGERLPLGTSLNRDFSLVRDRAYIVNEQGELVLSNGNPIERTVGDTDQFGVPNTNLVRERQAWTTARKANGAPIWASPVTKKVLKRITKRDPITTGGGNTRNTYTTDGIWGFFCQNGTYNGQPGGDVNRRRTYYLGGSPIDFSSSSTEEAGLNFRTLKPTLRDVYRGDFPVDRMEDSNDSWNMAAYAYAVDRFIFKVDLGEHWKDRQVHMVSAYISYGLMLFQYGAANRSDEQLEEAAPFLASNGKTGDFYIVPETNACVEVVCDEGMQGGILVSIITDLDTLWERSYPLETFTPEPTGVLNLHAGLPSVGTVANNTGRVRRFPETDTDSFSVKTAVLEPEAQFEGDIADLHITLRPYANGGVRQATVNLDFPDATRGKHEIKAIMRFLLGGADDTGDSLTVESYDSAGRTIGRWNRVRNSTAATNELRWNGLLAGSLTPAQWNPISHKRSVLRTGVDDTGLYMAYADFPKIYAAAPVDPLADAENAVGLRVIIDSRSQFVREFGLNLANATYTSASAISNPDPTPMPGTLELVPVADGRVLSFTVTGALKDHLDAGGSLNIGFKSSASHPGRPPGHWAKVRGVSLASGSVILSFTNEAGKLVLTTNQGEFTADLNELDENGNLYGDQFASRANANTFLGTNTFQGLLSVVNTPGPTSSTQRAANTAFVQSAILYSLTYTTGLVYRNGLPPLLWSATPLFDPFDGRGPVHDLLVLHGKTTAQFAMRFGDFKVSAHNFVVNNVFPGARFDNDTEDTITIDVAGITVLGTWSIYHSNKYSTRPLLVTVREAPLINFIDVYQFIDGTQPDRHRFVNCTIGRIGRSAAFAGQPRQLLSFERCIIGVGVTSGALTDSYAANDLSAQYIGCIFRLSGTATLGPTNQFGKNTFVNCTVVAADGTITMLDNRPTVQEYSLLAADPVQVPGKAQTWFRSTGQFMAQGPTGQAVQITTVPV